MKTLLILSFIACLFSMQAKADVAVIVNLENTATFSDGDISRIFLGKLKSFSSGEKAVPINLKLGSSSRNDFESKVLGKSSSQMKAYWSKRVFSGKGKPPPELVADQDIITMVASDSNVIAYVDSSSVDDTVKVIKIY
jgi:ABC-type phosphate transport system substrate-binding protein